MQPLILEPLEGDLGPHMLIEHAIFFLLGYISMIIAELITKRISLRRRERGSDYYYPGMSQNFKHKLAKHWINFMRKVFLVLNKRSLYLSIPVILIISIWHVPYIFDLALSSLEIHILQHLSFIFVGILVFLSFRFAFESYSILYLVSSLGMMILSAIVLSITDTIIYEYYSLDSHHRAGEYMIYLTLIMGFVVFPYYLISRTLFHIGKKNNT